MLQGSYGKEPFDLRLTVLRLLRQIHIVVIVTVLGVAVFGGGYYVKKVLLGGEKQYEITSVYHLEYDVEVEAEVTTVHINYATWNTYLQSDLFLDALLAHLESNNTMSDGSKLKLTKAELGPMLEAFVQTDLRMPSVAVTTNDPEKSTLISKAVEAAMVQEMDENIREVTDIQLIDSGVAEEVIPDVRTGRALILSAILSFFFVVLYLLLKETWEDGIYLPSSILKRYGVKCVGGIALGAALPDTEKSVAETEKPETKTTWTTKEMGENLAYFFGGKSKVALCPVSEDINPEVLLKKLQELHPETVGKEWFATPAPLLCPEICSELRGADGILLAVNSGGNVGKQFERVLEFFGQQDCEVTAVILTDVDAALLKCYYLGR